MDTELDSFAVLILAAGRGARMHSGKPKVLQSLLEEPVVYYPLKAVQDAGLKNVSAVVGHGGGQVETYLKREWPHVGVIWQGEQLGTAHAVMAARQWWEGFEHVMVVSGDVPLIQAGTLSDLAGKHLRAAPKCSFISFLLDDPSGYGRVVRLADGGVRIIEDRDAIEEELEIHEINSGVYIFDTESLSAVIEKINRDNTLGEYKITDAVALIGETEGDVNIVVSDDRSELLGVNTPNDLAVTAEILNWRIISGHMRNGLKCMDPRTTWIGPRVCLEPDVFVEPGVQIWGKSSIASGARIGAYSLLRNVTVGPGAVLFGPSVASDSDIGGGAEVGPFAVLRVEAVVSDSAKVGRFVEVKKSRIGVGAKVPHLSYIGDATIGEETNIGAGTITCNYNGKNKSRTAIGDRCFVGSDTMFVAPVSMGDDAHTAAGSVVTKDVPPGALAISRARQDNIANWSARLKIDGKEKKDDEGN